MYPQHSSPCATFDGAYGSYPSEPHRPMMDDGSQKPAYSYAALITAAINAQPSRRLTLSGIYDWIIDNFPFYRSANKGWKVRSDIQSPFL